MEASLCGIKAIMIMALAFALCAQSVRGDVTCEKLDRRSCAFAVSSSGTRCVLEKRVKRGGQEEYTCRASGIEAERLKDWIESDRCIASCGLDRNTLGVSSDALLDSHFTKKLCSPQCYQNCPNIVDLYFNLAAGEGVFLPKLCEAQGVASVRREMAQIQSSGIVAPGPEYGIPKTKNYVVAPSIPPAYPAATAPAY